MGAPIFDTCFQVILNFIWPLTKVTFIVWNKYKGDPYLILKSQSEEI
jgi:hypothetical protein